MKFLKLWCFPSVMPLLYKRNIQISEEIVFKAGTLIISNILNFFFKFNQNHSSKKYQNLGTKPFLCSNMLLALCVCVCLDVCVCLLPSTVKISSVRAWNSRRLINDVLKTFLSSAKCLHCYLSMKHQAFVTGCFILFTH